MSEMGKYETTVNYSALLFEGVLLLILVISFAIYVVIARGEYNENLHWLWNIVNPLIIFSFLGLVLLPIGWVVALWYGVEKRCTQN